MRSLWARIMWNSDLLFSGDFYCLKISWNCSKFQLRELIIKLNKLPLSSFSYFKKNNYWHLNLYTIFYVIDSSGNPAIWQPCYLSINLRGIQFNPPVKVLWKCFFKPGSTKLKVSPPLKYESTLKKGPFDLWSSSSDQ
jgi:hypothetical protein